MSWIKKAQEIKTNTKVIIPVNDKPIQKYSNKKTNTKVINTPAAEPKFMLAIHNLKEYNELLAGLKVRANATRKRSGLAKKLIARMEDL